MPKRRRLKNNDVVKDNKDSDDDKKVKRKRQKIAKPRYKGDVKKWSPHDQRRKSYRDDHSSRKDLKKLADDLVSRVAQVNNCPQFRQDVRAKADTIAVGLSKGRIIMTRNVKARRVTNSAYRTQYIKLKTPSKQNAKYGEYGIRKGLSNAILSTVSKSSVYKKSQLYVKVNLDKSKFHGAKRAETKLQAYCEQRGKELRKVAVSKEPFEGCRADLSRHAMVPETPGTKRVTNRRAVDKDDDKVRNRIDRGEKVATTLHLYNNGIHQSTKVFKEKTNIRRPILPDASIGIISGIGQLKDIIENKDFQPFTDGGMLNTGAGVVKNALGGQTYYARSSAIECRTGFGDLACLKVSALSAGARAEYGWNNCVGIQASVVRVDGNVGPVEVGVGLSFDTHVSVGLNGVSASFLGTGFSVGPKLAVQTPIFDISISPF